MKFTESSKKLLTTAEDRISLLYIEKAIIEQSKYGVQIRQKDKISEIPITTISCLLLGPGTSITHKAVENIADSGCSICWMGSEQLIFYAYGEPTTNSSKNLLKQIKYHESKGLHTEIIHKLYQYRYPNEKIKSLSLEELRGYEGQKMKECYEKYAIQYNYNWKGRHYTKGSFYATDLANQYITASNHLLYGITQAIIQILGFSPSIGFIHTGHIQSFTFDIADLFKEEITVPLAFYLATELKYFNRHKMLSELRTQITEKRVISRMVNLLSSLFDDTSTIDVELNIWNSFSDNEI